LYATPATRFVATFLGAANLLLARQTADGIRFGASPVKARAAERLEGSREHEVVAVLRPEEVELAPTRDNLRTNFIANGAVEELVFTGALERMRVRLSGDTVTPQLSSREAAGSAILEVTRTQHEQRGFPVAIGQSVAIGVRRIHVLPTPLSSYTACAADQAGADRLAQHPFLLELAARMKTRIVTRVEPALATLDGSRASTPISGVAVISARADAAAQVAWLLENDAGEVIVLPAHAGPPRRVLIHWLDDDARRPTLAVAASVLRHVAAEAVYLGIMPQTAAESQRPVGVRTLLDARSEAQAVHGLEMRTELRFGVAAEELQRQLSESPEQMLILGVSDLGKVRSVVGSLLGAASACSLIVVYRADE
jgi:sulfate/thiosulfate transport system ATP-binding protein